MPTLVQFGAGNIGRGFMAERFSVAGWSVVFVDVAAEVVAALNARGSYRVIEVEGVTERVVTVVPVQAIDGRDVAAVAAVLATADLAATAVGLHVLRHLGPALAAGLARRVRQAPEGASPWHVSIPSSSTHSRVKICVTSHE